MLCCVDIPAAVVDLDVVGIKLASVAFWASWPRWSLLGRSPPLRGGAYEQLVNYTMQNTLESIVGAA